MISPFGVEHVSKAFGGVPRAAFATQRGIDDGIRIGANGKKSKLLRLRSKNYRAGFTSGQEQGKKIGTGR